MVRHEFRLLTAGVGELHCVLGKIGQRSPGRPPVAAAAATLAAATKRPKARCKVQRASS
jgi:hypothetical protein